MIHSLVVVADLLDVPVEQVAMWRDGAGSPSPEQESRLNDLARLPSRAARIFERMGARNWTFNPNAFLGGLRPIDVLRTRGIEGAEVVLAAFGAAEQLAYGG
nr:antitoxin Xre/MbcA/ParS toxin-binding domain-containing protein [Nocardioides sp. zg-DK7169]